MVRCTPSSDDRGTRKGLFRRFGYADESYAEGAEGMIGWKLLFNPREAAESLRLVQALPRVAQPGETSSGGKIRSRRATRSRK